MTDLVPVSGRLAECERVIERGLGTFVEVGRALSEIRDDRLYPATHGTFEAYCQDRWNLSRSHAYELMAATQVVSAIADTGTEPPANEGQARELARTPEPERVEVWREANERTEGRPTAAVIREIREERQPPIRDLADVLEERMPGTRADLARSALRARWSKDMASVADIDLLDPNEVRAVIDVSEIGLAASTLRRMATWADRLERADPGLRIVGGTGD